MIRTGPAVVALTLLLMLPVTAVVAQDDDARQLRALFDDYERWTADRFPEWAMERGDYSDAARITDNSLDAFQRRHEDRERFLARLRGFKRSGLSAENRLNYDLFEILLEREIEAHRFRAYLAPIAGMSGPLQSIPQMAEGGRFTRIEDYENYVARLMLVPRSIDHTLHQLRTGMAEGRTPPRATLAPVPAQLDAIVDGDGLDALFQPFRRAPQTIDSERLSAAWARCEDDAMPGVRAAMRRLREFFNDEYLPRCRESIAAVDWPEGDAYYAYQLRRMTTTDLTAAQIHATGLREVARLRAQMLGVIRSTDFMSIHPRASSLDDDALFAAFIEYLRTDKRFYHQDAESLLTGYRDICKQVDGWMPKFFGTLPRLPYGVRPIADLIAPSQTTAYYQPGDLRNATAGIFYANTYALDQRPIYEMVALALHEAVPGHHHQMSIALEIEDVPEFRRQLWFTAFGEGWALYAERLGIDMGLYDDPYADFGRLLYEMWRACRLVVDPGMHAMGWSRQRAVDFMLENTALSELNVRTEVDRYIAWPGQATGYKIGELKITELRARAETRLGPRFDLREFHDVVLGAGSIPLTVLEARVDQWINSLRIPAYD